MEYPERVTKGEGGVYRWSVVMTNEHRKAEFRMMMRVCVIIGAAIFALYAILGMAVYGIAVLLGMTILPAGFWWLLSRVSRNQRRFYAMDDEAVTTKGWTRRSEGTFSYQRIHKVILQEDRIELRGLTDVTQVIVPHGDFAFVRDYILEHLPEKAEVVSEES